MTIDRIVVMVIYFGFLALLTLPAVQMVMWLIGCLFLLYIGIESIKEANQPLAFNTESESAKKSLVKSYVAGVVMAVTPANIMFWIGTFGTALTTALNGVDGYRFLLVASGILAGILIHDVASLGIINYSRKFLNQRIIKGVSVTAGVLLIGISCYFGYSFLTGLSEVL
jgi:threonine/homoserine/homoserine lactone efflux protein